jgi:hypothetical protein
VALLHGPHDKRGAPAERGLFLTGIL